MIPKGKIISNKSKNGGIRQKLLSLQVMRNDMKQDNIFEELSGKEYEHGFVTDVDQEFIPKGLNEDIIRLISAKKEEPEWLLDFRLDAFRKWQKMTVPTWGHLDIPEIDFQERIFSGFRKFLKNFRQVFF